MTVKVRHDEAPTHDDDLVNKEYADGLVGAGGIDLSTELGSDHTAYGTILTGETAGENLSFRDAVYKKSDGKWWKVDADAEATAHGSFGICVTVAGISADATGNIAVGRSWVRDDTDNWTIGGVIYVSTTTGELTQTPPGDSGDFVTPFGTAYSADIVETDGFAGKLWIEV